MSWPPVTTLAGYLNAGDLEGAAGMIRYAGKEADPGESADAIASCRDSGLDDATDDMLNYASRRHDRDILRIAKSLIEDDRADEVRTLLALSIS